MAARECLPEHHADRPDVGGLGGERAGKAFRRDVGERSGNVALGGQGLGLLDLGEAEVEDLRVNPAALCQQDVRRLDVTVDDPAPVSVRERLEDLGRSLDRRRVVELAASQAPRGRCDPGRTRRRCRRAASRGRTRRRADTKDDGGARPPRPPARLATPPSPPAARSSGPRRARSARRGRARPSRSRRSPGASAAGSGRERGRSGQGLRLRSTPTLQGWRGRGQVLHPGNGGGTG